MDTAKAQMTPEMEALKTKLKATWGSGDFGKIAESFTLGAADFVARLNLGGGMRVLDAACGSGNQSIPAARAGAQVVGIDIVPNLLEQAQGWAESEGLTVKFGEYDVENLPFQNGEFDVVMSMFGAMFAPRPLLVSAELIRVCRPGGRLALANWTPTGFIGQMFKATGKHVTPPASMPSPLLWGDEATVRTRLGDGVSKIDFERHSIVFTFPFGVAETIEYWREFYGPVNKAFAVLGAREKTALRRDLERLWAENNVAAGGATRVEAEYLEVVAIRG